MTFSDFAALARPRISLAVGGASLFGALLAGGGDPRQVLAAALGAVLLCAGCSALNQVQERRRDALMRRTADRPLPAGRTTPARATAVAVALGMGGLGLFLGAGGPTLAGVGLVVVLAYNGLYTPLKPVTPAALLVGGLAGALPPLTGWLAAESAPWHPVIVAVTGMVYLWQVPHFWLLAERRRDEYERAGFRVAATAMPRRLYRPLMALWIGAYFVGLACTLALVAGAGAGTLAPPLAAGVAVAAVAAAGREAPALAAVNLSMVLGMAAMLAA